MKILVEDKTKSFWREFKGKSITISSYLSLPLSFVFSLSPFFSLVPHSVSLLINFSPSVTWSRCVFSPCFLFKMPTYFCFSSSFHFLSPLSFLFNSMEILVESKTKSFWTEFKGKSIKISSNLSLRLPFFSFFSCFPFYLFTLQLFPVSNMISLLCSLSLSFSFSYLSLVFHSVFLLLNFSPSVT